MRNFCLLTYFLFFIISANHLAFANQTAVNSEFQNIPQIQNLVTACEVYITNFIMGVFFITAVYHLFIWTGRKMDKTNLYFSLLCFCTLLYQMVFNHSLFTLIKPAHSCLFELREKLRHLAVFTLMILHPSYYATIYPHEFPKKFLKFGLFTSLLFSFFILITNARIYEKFYFIFVFAVFVMNIIIFYNLLNAYFKKKDYSLYIIINFFILLITIIYDIIIGNGVINGKGVIKIHSGFIVPFGFSFFIISQSIILSKKFSRTFQRAEYLSHNLQGEVKKKTEHLQKQKQELEQVNQKLKDMAKYRTEFFQNITHELATPLTLIMGPVKTLLKKFKNQNDTFTRKNLEIMHHNVEHLASYINQILDLTRIEIGREKLEASQVELTGFIRTVLSQFENVFIEKNIDVKFFSPVQEINLFLDILKMKKILSNLITNAIKFSADNTLIRVTISDPLKNNKLIIKKNDRKIIPEKVIQITINDQGFGIPQSELKKIFTRFHQVDSSTTREKGGLGIGLSLVEEYIKLHHGNIQATSKKNQGSSFIITLPLGSRHLNPNELNSKTLRQNQFSIANPNLEKTIVNKNIRTAGDEKKDTVLVIEDNIDMLSYIKSNLENKYNILTAVNGRDGLELAVNRQPDLIISDIMMPKMDGYQLLTELTNNPHTNWIPFIFLTAKSEKIDKVTGLKLGAYDFINKPFSIEYLAIKAEILINNTKKLKQSYIREFEKKIYRLLRSENISNDKNLVKDFNLTDKEKMVLQMLLDGFEYKEISYKLNLSLSAVKKRIHSLYKKCGVKSRIQLVNLTKQSW